MIKFLIFLDLALSIHGQFNQNQSPDYVVNNVCYCVTKGSCVDGRPTTSNPNNNNNNVGNGKSTLEPSDGSIDSRIFHFGTTSSSAATVRRTVQSNQNQNQNSNNNGNGMNFFNSATTPPPITPVSPGQKTAVNNQTTCATGLELCCPSKGFTCGTRYPPVEGAPAPTDPSQAPYGNYPWDATILSILTNEYFGAGALIDHRHVVTAAHKVHSVTDIKCRFGEWNMNSNFEPFPAQEVDVDDEGIIIHPEFKSLKTLLNNIAILRLEAPGVQLGLYPTITNICLPSQPLANMRCWVAGWGKSDFQSNSFQTILKQVSLPLVDYWTCQNMLRATRLGPGFNLNALSFICAGGEQNKDACTGDGGAALACEVDGQFYLAGLVAWGIGCGTLNVPGVYVNIYNFIPWIQSVVKKTSEMSQDITATTRSSRATTVNQGVTTTIQMGGPVSTTRVITTSSATTVTTSRPATTSTVVTTLATNPPNTTTTSRATTVVTTLATTLAPNTTVTTGKPAATNAPVTNTTTRAPNTTLAATTTKPNQAVTTVVQTTTKPAVITTKAPTTTRAVGTTNEGDTTFEGDAGNFTTTEFIEDLNGTSTVDETSSGSGDAVSVSTTTKPVTSVTSSTARPTNATSATTLSTARPANATVVTTASTARPANTTVSSVVTTTTSRAANVSSNATTVVATTTRPANVTTSGNSTGAVTTARPANATTLAGTTLTTVRPANATTAQNSTTAKPAGNATAAVTTTVKTGNVTTTVKASGNATTTKPGSGTTVKAPGNATVTTPKPASGATTAKTTVKSNVNGTTTKPNNSGAQTTTKPGATTPKPTVRNNNPSATTAKLGNPTTAKPNGQVTTTKPGNGVTTRPTTRAVTTQKTTPKPSAG